MGDVLSGADPERGLRQHDGVQDDDSLVQDHSVVQDHARALADAIDSAIPGWVRRCVTSRLPDGASTDAVAAAADEAGARARAEMGPRIRSLLAADIDDQRTTPLALLRETVRYPTGVLAAAGAPPVRRDEAQERLFPDDVYDLNPATFADVDPALADLGVAWGAAKAWAHRRRHRAAS